MGDAADEIGTEDAGGAVAEIVTEFGAAEDGVLEGLGSGPGGRGALNVLCTQLATGRLNPGLAVVDGVGMSRFVSWRRSWWSRRLKMLANA